MSEHIVQLPESIAEGIKKLAEREGSSVGQFLASAASEKLAALTKFDSLRREAAAGSREDFEAYLDRVPDGPPVPGDELPVE